MSKCSWVLFFVSKDILEVWGCFPIQTVYTCPVYHVFIPLHTTFYSSVLKNLSVQIGCQFWLKTPTLHRLGLEDRIPPSGWCLLYLVTRPILSAKSHIWDTRQTIPSHLENSWNRTWKEHHYSLCFAVAWPDVILQSIFLQCYQHTLPQSIRFSVIVMS